MTIELAGLLTPLKRDRKRDFASGSGPELLKSKVIQVLMTEGDTTHSSGELPWRTALGSAIHLLRHQRNDEVVAELARVYVRDALKKWLPGVTVTSVIVEQDSEALCIRVQFKGADQRENSAEIQLS